MKNPDPQIEILDLVNESDEIIGEVEKDVANSDPSLIHREVGIFIFDDQKRVLVQQRSFKKSHGPGQWTIAAAGHVPKGMSYEEAAHKELQEELSFDTNLISFGKILNHIPEQTRFTMQFLGKYNGETIKIQTEELEQAKFITEGEFEAMSELFGELSKKALREFWTGKYDIFISELSPPQH